MKTLLWTVWVAVGADEAPKLALNPDQIKVIDTINQSGPAIDACVNRYVQEYPSAQGKLSLSVMVGPDGRVVSSRAETALPGARNLRPCIEGVARRWRLPEPKEESATLGIDIPVRPGAKFKLKKPGEKEPKPKKSPKQEEPGFMRIQPTGWGFTPNGW